MQKLSRLWKISCNRSMHANLFLLSLLLLFLRNAVGHEKEIEKLEWDLSAKLTDLFWFWLSYPFSQGAFLSAPVTKRSDTQQQANMDQEANTFTCQQLPDWHKMCGWPLIGFKSLTFTAQNSLMSLAALHLLTKGSSFLYTHLPFCLVDLASTRFEPLCLQNRLNSLCHRYGGSIPGSFVNPPFYHIPVAPTAPTASVVHGQRCSCFWGQQMDNGLRIHSGIFTFQALCPWHLY